MKNFLSAFVLILFLAGCEKNDDSPVLPPVSETGARTFGCLINGNVFSYSGNEINAYYTVANNHLSITAENLGQDPRMVWLGTTYLPLEEGQTYQLAQDQAERAWAQCRFITPNEISEFSSTNENYTGEMTIAKLDFENNIISGTFWFDLEHPISGETVEIREGRFDVVMIQQ